MKFCENPNCKLHIEVQEDHPRYINFIKDKGERIEAYRVADDVCPTDEPLYHFDTHKQEKVLDVRAEKVYLCETCNKFFQRIVLHPDYVVVPKQMFTVLMEKLKEQLRISRIFRRDRCERDKINSCIRTVFKVIKEWR